MRSFLLYAEATLLTLAIVFAARSPACGPADSALLLHGLRRSFHPGDDQVGRRHWLVLRESLAGHPGTLKIYDFPFAETGTFLGVKLFFLLSRDPYLAGNLFYLATYVLASWTSLYVLRKFGVQDQVAVAASLLFAFTPYHLWRGMAHLHLSAYYPIPLVVMVSLWLCHGSTPGSSSRTRRAGATGLA